MSEIASRKARLAALVKHGAGPAVVGQAREALAAENLRKAIDGQRARSGLPPAASDLEALGYVSKLLAREAVA